MQTRIVINCNKLNGGFAVDLAVMLMMFVTGATKECDGNALFKQTSRGGGKDKGSGRKALKVNLNKEKGCSVFMRRRRSR
jgi:hypothetical protein